MRSLGSLKGDYITSLSKGESKRTGFTTVATGNYITSLSKGESKPFL